MRTTLHSSFSWRQDGYILRDSSWQQNVGVYYFRRKRDGSDCSSGHVEDTNVNRTQRRKILRHLTAYFGLRLTAHEHDLMALGQGYFKPITDHYFDPNKKKDEYWYTPVDELLAHEVDEMLSVQQIETIQKVDVVVGADHGRSEFRMHFGVY
jgi:hypothetical protein